MIEVRITNQVLEGKEVSFKILDAEVAKALAHELAALGAKIVCGSHEGP